MWLHIGNGVLLRATPSQSPKHHRACTGVQVDVGEVHIITGTIELKGASDDSNHGIVVEALSIGGGSIHASAGAVRRRGARGIVEFPVAQEIALGDDAIHRTVLG